MHVFFFFLDQVHFSALELNLCQQELLTGWQSFRLVFHAGGVEGYFFRPDLHFSINDVRLALQFNIQCGSEEQICSHLLSSLTFNWSFAGEQFRTLFKNQKVYFHGFTAYVKTTPIQGKLSTTQSVFIWIPSRHSLFVSFK